MNYYNIKNQFQANGSIPVKIIYKYPMTEQNLCRPRANTHINFNPPHALKAAFHLNCTYDLFNSIMILPKTILYLLSSARFAFDIV